MGAYLIFSARSISDSAAKATNERSRWPKGETWRASGERRVADEMAGADVGAERNGPADDGGVSTALGETITTARERGLSTGLALRRGRTAASSGGEWLGVRKGSALTSFGGCDADAWGRMRNVPSRRSLACLSMRRPPVTVCTSSG